MSQPDWLYHSILLIYALLPPTWAKDIVLGLCVCCLSWIISKSKQAASHKLGNLRQTVVLYNTRKFLQASMAQIA